MPDRHPDRERWEVLITQILLAFRPILFAGGVILSVFAGLALLFDPLVGCIAVGLGIFLLGLYQSDQVVLLVARLGGWLATVGRD